MEEEVTCNQEPHHGTSEDSSYESDENLFDDIMNIADSVERSLSLVDSSTKQDIMLKDTNSDKTGIEPYKGTNTNVIKDDSYHNLKISLIDNDQPSKESLSDTMLSAVNRDQQCFSLSSEVKGLSESNKGIDGQGEDVEVCSNASSKSSSIESADIRSCCMSSNKTQEANPFGDSNESFSTNDSSPTSSISSTCSVDKQKLYRMLSTEKEASAMPSLAHSLCYHFLVKGVPLHSGFLMKLGGTGLTPKNWRKRWFVLRSDNCLYYYKNPNSKPAGGIVLSNYLVTAVLGNTSKNFAFQLTKGGARTYSLAAFSETEMRTWMQVISESSRSDDKTRAAPEYSVHNISIPALSIKDPDCHGYIWKQGQVHKSWKRRYAVLKDGSLFYYKDMSETTAIGVFCLHCYSVNETESTCRKNGIVAVPPQPLMRTYYFATETENDRERWVKALQNSIDLADCM